jgi:phosphate transport system protein
VLPHSISGDPERPLDRLEDSMLEALDLLGTSLECSIEAIERQDVTLASMVVSNDRYTDARYVEVNAGVVSALGTGSLTPADLRTAMALLRVSRHVERIGDHCANLANLVRLDAGRSNATDAVLLERIGEMGHLAHGLLWQSRVVLAERDVAVAENLAERDRDLNQLNRECFRRALAVGDERDRREWAMYMILAARWLERIGDNAVDIGEAVAFASTGTIREFTGGG